MSKVYVILQNAFSYSEYCQVCFEVYKDEKNAKKRVKELNLMLKEYKEKYSSYPFDKLHEVKNTDFFKLLKLFWEGIEMDGYDSVNINDFFYEDVEMMDEVQDE